MRLLLGFLIALTSACSSTQPSIGAKISAVDSDSAFLVKCERLGLVSTPVRLAWKPNWQQYSRVELQNATVKQFPEADTVSITSLGEMVLTESVATGIALKCYK
jgi:hypothetical protein